MQESTAVEGRLNNNSQDNESKRCQQEPSSNCRNGGSVGSSCSLRRASFTSASFTSASILGSVSPSGHSMNGNNRRGSGFPLTSSSDRIRMSSLKIWENAKTPSFYARDNVSNFLQWCRFLSVREAVLFESEDLVLHTNPKNVVLCLLEVARIVCTRHAFSPTPGLVELEKEIDAQIEAEEAAAVSGSSEDSTKTARNTLHLPLILSPQHSSQNGEVNKDETDGHRNSSNQSGHEIEDSSSWRPSELPSDVPPSCPSPSAASLMSTVSIASARSSGDTSVVDQKDLSAQLDQKVIMIVILTDLLLIISNQLAPIIPPIKKDLFRKEINVRLM